ncbi:Receptor-like protein 1 [Linum perenne]
MRFESHCKFMARHYNGSSFDESHQLGKLYAFCFLLGHPIPWYSGWILFGFLLSDSILVLIFLLGFKSRIVRRKSNFKMLAFLTPYQRNGFHSYLSNLIILDLSDNQIRGNLPVELHAPKLDNVDLASNRFEVPVPRWSTNETQCYLHENIFSGPLPRDIGTLMPRLRNLHLSDNNLNGTIPSSICNMADLQVLSLRNNHLSGELPDCWEELSALWVVNVSNNDLSEALCNLQLLHFLDLSHNNLSGGIPKCLHNLTAMVYGNSSELYYRDFQFRMAYFKEETTVVRAYDYYRNIALLNVIDLSENNLTGLIPDEMTKLQAVRVLNLSNNHIIGEIPKKIGDLKPEDETRQRRNLRTGYWIVR